MISSYIYIYINIFRWQWQDDYGKWSNFTSKDSNNMLSAMKGQPVKDLISVLSLTPLKELDHSSQSSVISFYQRRRGIQNL